MRIIIEYFKKDPLEAIGSVIAWAGLFTLVFMLSCIG